MKKQIPYIDPFREAYRPLTDAEKQVMAQIKSKAKAMYDMLEDEFPVGPSRDKAVESLHECVFWAVHGLTSSTAPVKPQKKSALKIMNRKR